MYRVLPHEVTTRGRTTLNKREMPKAQFGFIDLRWQEQAQCSGSDTETFYHDTWEKRREELVLLKKMCSHCPVAAECLDYALQTNEAYGIWGGLTPAERRLVRRRAARRAS